MAGFFSGLMSAGSSGALSGIANLIGAGAGMYGAINQSRTAKKQLGLERDSWNAWNQTRLANQNNLAQGFNSALQNYNNQKKAGMLNLAQPILN